MMIKSKNIISTALIAAVTFCSSTLFTTVSIDVEGKAVQQMTKHKL